MDTYRNEFGETKYLVTLAVADWRSILAQVESIDPRAAVVIREAVTGNDAEGDVQLEFFTTEAAAVSIALEDRISEPDDAGEDLDPVYRIEHEPRSGFRTGPTLTGEFDTVEEALNAAFLLIDAGEYVGHRIVQSSKDGIVVVVDHEETEKKYWQSQGYDG